MLDNQLYQNELEKIVSVKSYEKGDYSACLVHNLQSNQTESFVKLSGVKNLPLVATICACGCLLFGSFPMPVLCFPFPFMTP